MTTNTFATNNCAQRIIEQFTPRFSKEPADSQPVKDLCPEDSHENSPSSSTANTVTETNINT